MKYYLFESIIIVKQVFVLIAFGLFVLVILKINITDLKLLKLKQKYIQWSI